MRHCGQRGVKSLPTPIYQPASPKQRDRREAAVQTGLCTWPQPEDRAAAVYSAPLPQWSHWQGISMRLPRAVPWPLLPPPQMLM